MNTMRKILFFLIALLVVVGMPLYGLVFVSAESTNTIYLDNNSGNDTNDGLSERNAVKTFNQALHLMTDGGEIVVKSFDKQSGIVFNKKGTLLIDENITLTGSDSDEGIILGAGSILKVSDGKTLTMNGYQRAIDIQKDAILSDGKYIVEGSVFGFRNHGKIEGSSKNALIMTVTSTGRGMEYNNDAIFKNAIISLEAKSDKKGDDSGAWGGHGGLLHLENVDLTTTDYRFNLQSTPKNLYMDHSTLSIKGKWSTGGFFSTPQAMGIVGVNGQTSEIKNGSKLIIDGARITISDKVVLTDSTLEIKNSSSGGLNINYGGEVTFENSKLITSGLSSYPAYGVQKGSLIFKGNSVVNTPAKNASVDNGGRALNATYVVTGGSFMIKSSDKGRVGSYTEKPTNGVENDNEELTLFTLKDSNLSEIFPLNKKGTEYQYSVSQASEDGKKHVWVPKATVTFDLNNENATFADNTNGTKEQSTIRGYALNAVENNTEVEKLIVPNNHSHKVFKGWFYTDENGIKKEYKFSDKIITDMRVTADWGDEEPYKVTFDTNGGNSIETLSVERGTSIDLSKYVPIKKNNQDEDNIFLGWYTDKQLSNKVEGEYTPTSNVTLFAKWDLHPNPISQSLVIHGDILVQKEGDKTFDTENQSLFNVYPKDTLNFKATIQAIETQEYLDMLKTQLLTNRPWLTDKRDGDKITLEKMKSTFEAVITVPQGIIFPENQSAYNLDGGPFVISKIENVSGKVKITMELQISKLLTFADLYEAIHKPLELLTLDVSGVKVADEVVAGDELTVMGEVTGNFEAVAVSPKKLIDGNPHDKQEFSFDWEAIQDKQLPVTKENGQDFKLNGQDVPTISLTLKIMNMYEVSYEFNSSSVENVLPDEVRNLLPNAEKDKKPGDVVIPKMPKETSVSANGGLWIFKGYNSKKETVVDRDVTFVGTWEFEAGKGSVHIEYLDKDGNSIQEKYVDTNAAPQGTHYNAEEQKVDGTNEKPDIIIYNGKKYKFLKLADDSVATQGVVESGKILIVKYVYKVEELIPKYPNTDNPLHPSEPNRPSTDNSNRVDEPNRPNTDNPNQVDEPNRSSTDNPNQVDEPNHLSTDNLNRPDEPNYLNTYKPNALDISEETLVTDKKINTTLPNTGVDTRLENYVGFLVLSLLSSLGFSLVRKKD